jgi:hypothetical protein
MWTGTGTVVCKAHKVVHARVRYVYRWNKQSDCPAVPTSTTVLYIDSTSIFDSARRRRYKQQDKRSQIASSSRVLGLTRMATGKTSLGQLALLDSIEDEREQAEAESRMAALGDIDRP